MWADVQATIADEGPGCYRVFPQSAVADSAPAAILTLPAGLGPGTAPRPDIDPDQRVSKAAISRWSRSPCVGFLVLVQWVL